MMGKCTHNHPDANLNWTINSWEDVSIQMTMTVKISIRRHRTVVIKLSMISFFGYLGNFAKHTTGHYKERSLKATIFIVTECKKNFFNFLWGFWYRTAEWSCIDVSLSNRPIKKCCKIFCRWEDTVLFRGPLVKSGYGKCHHSSGNIKLQFKKSEHNGSAFPPK